MVITLEEAKLYLRIDSDEEDTLISSFILASEEICEGILRYSLLELDPLPESIKQVVLYGVSNMYEQRDKLDIKSIIDVMKQLLFVYRKGCW